MNGILVQNSPAQVTIFGSREVSFNGRDDLGNPPLGVDPSAEHVYSHLPHLDLTDAAKSGDQFPSPKSPLHSPAPLVTGLTTHYVHAEAIINRLLYSLAYSFSSYWDYSFS